MDEKELFLLDSGGQYIDGTTDITRTVHFGEPSARERECFTRVLQVKYTFLPAMVHLLYLRREYGRVFWNWIILQFKSLLIGNLS